VKYWLYTPPNSLLPSALYLFLHSTVQTATNDEHIYALVESRKSRSGDEWSLPLIFDDLNVYFIFIISYLPVLLGVVGIRDAESILRTLRSAIDHISRFETFKLPSEKDIPPTVY